MGQVTFDKCCFCVELKTGCFIIGYLNLIAYVIALVMAGLSLGAGITVVSLAEKEDQRSAGALIIGISILLLLFVALFLAFTIVYLVGLHKNKPGHVKAYLIYGVVFVIITIIYTIIAIAGGAATASGIIQQILTILLNIYFLLVIRSQYFIMTRGPQNGPAIYNTA